MPAPIESPTDNYDWDAENDADTLARAKEIMDDTIRLNKAKNAAVNMAVKKMEQVKSLMEAAGRSFSQTYKGFTISAEQSSIE